MVGVAQPFGRLGVGVTFGVPIDVLLIDHVAIGVDVLDEFLQPHRPVLRVGDHRVINLDRLTVVSVALQVAQRHPVRLPAPPVVVIDHGEAALGVVRDGFGAGLCACPLEAQLGCHVVELRCASGGHQTIDGL